MKGVLSDPTLNYTKPLHFKNLENSHSEDFKIGTQKEKEEGCGLTDQSWVDDTDCTQLEGSPELCSEVKYFQKQCCSADLKEIGVFIVTFFFWAQN